MKTRSLLLSISTIFITCTIVFQAQADVKAKTESQNKNLDILGTELFWEAECHPQEGLRSYDFTNTLQRMAQVDALGVNLKSAQLVGHEKVILSGHIFALLCQRPNDKEAADYKWQYVSLEKNAAVTPVLFSEHSVFYAKDFPIQITDKWNFKVEVDAKEFFSRETYARLSQFEKSGNETFQILFRINNLSPHTSWDVKRPPFIEYKYNIKAGNENTRVFDRAD